MAELKNIRIAISGIYDYAFEELGNLGLSFSNAPDFTEKKAIYKVYRPATVLASAVDKFKMLPLTHHHPRNPVDEKNFRELTIGFTDSNPFVDYLEDKNEVGIRSTALLYDSEALDAYERGEIQLSPGYFADFEWQNGVSPNGEKYDIIMKEIKDVNHLALLPNGRGGNDAVVLDSRKTIFDIVREQMQKDGAPEGNDNASKEHKKEEKDKNGLSFVKNSKGKIDFGEINEEQAKTMGLKSAPIRLSEGSELTYGKAHIEYRHGNEIRNAGYKNIDSFVEDIIENFDEIHRGNEAIRNGEKIQGFYLVKTTNKGILGIELEKSEHEDFYTVNNGGMFGNPRYLKKKEILWSPTQNATSSKGIDENIGKDTTDKALGVSTAAQQFTEPSDILIDVFDSYKTIFEIVQMNIFDQIRYGAI